MSVLSDSLMGSHIFLNFFRVKKYIKEFKKNHPDYFEPEGIMIFSAFQRSRQNFKCC